MSGKWMLVVDDDPDHAFLATRVIAQHDPMIAVEICETGAEAVRVLEMSPDACPLAIFVDIGLHNENGLMLIDRIRKLEGCSRVPIAVLTASANDETRIEALLLEASAYICKPLTAARLQAMLQGQGFHWDMRDLPADLARYHRRRRERDSKGDGA
jgi:CheY-like chemotaxis protein